MNSSFTRMLVALVLTLPAASFATETRTASLSPLFATGSAMRAGGMLVRLENFRELRDGTVHAEISFQNEGTTPAALKSSVMPRLVNADGKVYRVRDVKRVGDGASGEWISVEPGTDAVFAATFEPDGQRRGIQPFALTMPVRMTWRADARTTAQTRSFDIKFGGIQRETERVARAPVPPVQTASLPPPEKTQPAAPAAFNDDLAPRIAALPAAKPDARRYLFAVGIEQYDDAPAVPFATRSTEAVATLLGKRYGIPADNVTIVTGDSATGTKILGRLKSTLARLREGDTLYFYYAGHGLPGRDGNSLYVVPKDAVPGAYEAEQFALTSLLRRFEESAATRVVAFLDTCFSGRVGRNESLFKGTGPLVPTARAPDTGKTTLFVAGQSFQFANDYPERGHRLFSYFLMRGMLDGIDEPKLLESYVAREVRRVSAKRGAEFVQEPQLTQR